MFLMRKKTIVDKLELEAGTRILDATPANFLLYYKVADVKFFIPANDELYFEKLAKTVSDYVMEGRFAN